MKILLSVIFFFSVLVTCYSQNIVTGNGNVEIIQDKKITRLTEQYKEINKVKRSIDGYRLQIYYESGNNSKKLATDVAAKFSSLFPDTKAYISFKQPYYRVRVGDFRTLIETVGFQKKIKTDFPNSFPVKEKINYPKL